MNMNPPINPSNLFSGLLGGPIGPNVVIRSSGGGGGDLN